MKLTELFSSNEFVVTAEMGPPKGMDLSELLSAADKHLRCVDAINVTDCQSSVMRLGSLVTCKALTDAGHNTVFQLTCRDRNRIALQSDLLGAAHFGIENVLLLTGDHTTLGDCPQAKPVYDLDSVSLLQAASKLEAGGDFDGNELTPPLPSFSKGAVVSPCSDSLDAQLRKMELKVRSGARFFQTQTVYEPGKFIEFMNSAKQFGVPVMLGMVILKGAGMANFMNRNIAGVNIPQQIIDELAADKERAKSGVSGIEIAARIIKECRPYCQGLHIMQLGWDDKVPLLLERVGLRGSRGHAIA